jgi:hypothetical protein
MLKVQRFNKTLDDIQEEEEEQDNLTIRITIVKKVLHEELLRLCIFPYRMCSIGNHSVELLNTTPTPEVLQIQFCGLLWLEKFKDVSSVTVSVSYISMQKFIAYMYGIKLFEKYKNPQDVQESLNEKVVEAVTYKEKDLKNRLSNIKSAEKISDLLCKTRSQELEIFTDDFGSITEPTESEWDLFYSKVKVCHSNVI